MTTLVKRFRLASDGRGVACDQAGLAVGSVPLLKQGTGGSWMVRPTAEIDRDLGDIYGFPIQVQNKRRGLAAVARALNEGELALAQLTALYLKLPDPPPTERNDADAELIRSLLEAGLLKWDAAKHPRWPAGSPDGVGGRFVPAGAEEVSARQSHDAPEARRVEAQATPIPLPGAGVGEGAEAHVGFPIPWDEIAPPVPLTPPNSTPYNPYPRRQKCVREWQRAYEYCDGLFKKKNWQRRIQRRGRQRLLSMPTRASVSGFWWQCC